MTDYRTAAARLLKMRDQLSGPAGCGRRPRQRGVDSCIAYLNALALANDEPERPTEPMVPDPWIEGLRALVESQLV